MEMTLTVHVPRRRPRPVDVHVRWSGRHTARDLCAALADHLGEPVAHLSTRGRDVPSDAALGLPPLVHGAAVTVGGSAGSTPPVGLLHLAVVGGPDAGRTHPLTPPALVVGRAPAAGLVLGDEALSRDHAVFRVSQSGVVVEDLGSTNGVLVDGLPIERPTPVDSTSVVVLGTSTLRLRRPPARGATAAADGDGHEVVSTPSPRTTPEEVVEIACPPPPAERHRTRVPWLAALVPIPVGVALALFLGPQLLAFALLGPVMLLASALGDRWGAGRGARRDLAAHAAAVREARDQLAAALTVERLRLDRLHPDPQAVLATVEHRMPGLWVGDDRLVVRLGIGETPTRVAWADNGTRSHPSAAGTPVTVALRDVEYLGVVGPDILTHAVLRSVVGQLCAAHPPTRLGLAVASSSSEWSWSRWLPHLVDVAVTTDAVGALADAGGGSGSLPRPAYVLVVPARDTGPPGEVVSAARAAGWIVVVAARERSSLPGGAGSVLVIGHGRIQAFEPGSGPPVPVVPDLVGVWWSDRVARALAPLRCADAGTVRPALPHAVGLTDLLGSAAADPAATAEGWARAAVRGGGLAPPAAVVGSGPHGIHAIDLSRDGPHVLVGGTTGSGKSEFLRTLVVSLAISTPPSDLTLVLVDFKGGAAFGPCADLPHVVGLVTDLDDHLVARALTSLRAELRRRERMLAEAGAPDLEAYARSPHARDEPMPRLVVVVDELRTLVDEVPDFVSGLVRLAAQGRSLGIHLVLATQRPAGAVTAEVQANVSLRIAFRLRDRGDSVAVVEDAAAADLPAVTPGRAVARGPDGRLVTFQSAILGPASPREHPRFLQLTRVEPRGAASAPGTPAATAATGHGAAGCGFPGDGSLETTAALQQLRARATAQIVETVTEAHRRTGAAAPRRPWLPALPRHVSAKSLSAGVEAGREDGPPGARLAGGAGAGKNLGRRGVAVGLVDEPDLQRVSALRWHPDDGTWLLAGASRSGRTTALRCIVRQATRAVGPRTLHVHLVDPSSVLADLMVLPNVGTRVSGADGRALGALVEHLRSEVDRRRATTQFDGRAGPDPRWQPTVLVAVDGWEQFVETHPDTAWSAPVDDLLRVLRDGASVGVVGAVAGGRSLLQPRWAGIAGCTVLLGRLDPLDLALAGLRAADVPTEPPPGRGIRLADRREVQLAMVDAASSVGPVDRFAPRPTEGGAWRYRPLPERVDLPPTYGSDDDGTVQVAAGPGSGAGAEADGIPALRVRRETGRHVLGVADGDHEGLAWLPAQDGRVLLVCGPHRSGRTNVLRVLAASIADGGRAVAVVTRAPRWPACGPGDRVTLVRPDDVAALVEARRRDPSLAILVDDADLLDEAPVSGPLHEVLGLVDRDDGLLVVVSSPSALASRFRGLDVAVARRRTALLLAPAPADGDLVGAARLHGIPSLPGRGVFFSGGVATELQVYLAPESGVGVDAGGRLLGGGREQRSRARGHGHGEDAPSDQGLVALDQPDPHGDEEGAPHDRRGLGPGCATEPAPGQGREAEAADEDEHRRHDDAGRVAALTDGELVDVEHGEAHEDEGLEAGQHGGEAAGTA